jgi:fucose permease
MECPIVHCSIPDHICTTRSLTDANILQYPVVEGELFQSLQSTADCSDLAKVVPATSCSSGIVLCHAHVGVAIVPLIQGYFILHFHSICKVNCHHFTL